MTKKAIIWTVIGSVFGAGILIALMFLFLFVMKVPLTGIQTILPTTTISKEDAQNIINSISKNYLTIKDTCYQTYDKKVPIQEINNNTNIYDIKLDASYKKYLVNDTLYLKFNDLSTASLTQDTTINFSAKEIINKDDSNFFNKIKAIKIILTQKQLKATNHTYVININENAFSQFLTLTDFGIYNVTSSGEDSNYYWCDNWVNYVDETAFPVSLVNFYCDANFYPFSTQYKKSNIGLFSNNVNLKSFVYNGQIYNNNWFDENNNLYEPYLFTTQYKIPIDCFDKCGKDFKLYSTCTYGFNNETQKANFDRLRPKDFIYKKIPMYFDYKSDPVISDWGLPEWIFDSILHDPYKKIPLLLMVYRFDYYYTAKEYPPPTKLPFKGKLFSGFYINRALYNKIYKK